MVAVTFISTVALALARAYAQYASHLGDPLLNAECQNRPARGVHEKTDTPANPPSPADADLRAHKAALLQALVVRRMKQAYPDLPY